MVTRAGFFKCRPAMARIRWGIVAENSAVWRCQGSLQDRFEILDEAHVEHLVGLIEHEHGGASSSSVSRRM